MPMVLSRAWEKFFEIQHAQPEDTNELLQKLLEDLQIISEELAEYISSLSWNHPTFYNNNEEHYIQYKEYLKNSSNAIVATNFNQERKNHHKTPTFEVKNIVEQPTKRRTRVNAITTVLPIKEPEYSLSMGYKHLSTNPETESDEVIKSSVKNLVQIPIEYEVTSNNESECDVPVKDDSSPIFTTFSNPLFDCNDDFTSSDDELISKEDVPMENFKICSNPLFDDEEISSNKIDPHYFNVESNLIESLSNQNTLFDSSPKFDYLEEFSGELMPTSIINEERIKRANTIIETLPTSPISVEDSDSLREEIDIFTGTDDLMPPGIESDDYNSERDIHFLKELLSNDSISLPENESSNFDHHDDSSFPRPPSEPPDVEIFFEPDSGVVTTNVVKVISEHYVLMPNIYPTLPTLCLNFDILLPFSSENEDKVFKPSILSYLLVSHRDKTTSDFSENPIMMYRGDIPSKVVSDLHTIPMDK
nr:hypothetical protein [Tanacetum cinerariifolium]